MCEDGVYLSSEFGKCNFVLKQFTDYSFDAGVIISGYPIVVLGDRFHVTKHDIDVFVLVIIVLVDLYGLLAEVVE